MDWKEETASELRRAQGYVEGWTDAQVHNILLALKVRHIPVSRELRERLLTCHEPEELETLFLRAIDTTTCPESWGNDVTARALVARVEVDTVDGAVVVRIVPEARS
ncbi:hypothetical protein LVJ94_06175 [Pendulispora rubella]|uniref:Uncharacterized protein n=1 Tax=Pendulispora rubella TaxID=2741070 RepID=A0ABZ2L7A9_9BACT